MQEIELINIMAGSIDGHIAAAHLESDQDRAVYGFSIKEDQEFVREQIRSADAIITGAASMRASSGAWQQTGNEDKFPHWIVLTRQGLAPELKFWHQNQIPRTLVSPQPVNAHEINHSQVENWIYPPEVEAKGELGSYILSKLATYGYQKVLLFGGGAINRIFYEEGLVKELKLTLCPFLIGNSDAPKLVDPQLSQPVKLKLLSSQAVQSHVFLNYKIES